LSRSRDYVGDIPSEMAERILRKKREKAERILEENRVIETSGPGIYIIANGKGNNYSVNLGKESCTCPDYEYRRAKCKHIIAAQAKDDEIKQRIWHESQGGEGLKRIGNGSYTNADTSKWKLYDKAVLGLI